MKKRVVKNILLVSGILFTILFAGSIIYDYSLMNTRIFANPLGLGFTALTSGVIFLLPGIICLTIAGFLKRKDR